MRSYSNIVPTFWLRGSGKKLRGNPVAQVLALYFLTAPSSNMIGLYYLTLTSICSETGISEADVKFYLPLINEIVIYDLDHELVWIPEHAAYQIGESMHGNDKRRVSVMKELGLIGSHPFVAAFIKRYGDNYKLPVEISQLSFYSDTQLKGHPGDEMPRVLSCPDLVTDPDPVASPEPETKEPTELETVKKIFEFWKEKMGKPKSKLDSARLTKIRARLQDFSPRELCLAIIGASKDDWIMGRDPKGNGKLYNDFRTIFRDSAKVEQLIEFSKQKRGMTGQLFEQDPDIAKAKAAETAIMLAKKKEKDLEFNRKIAESKTEIINNKADLLGMINI